MGLHLSEKETDFFKEQESYRVTFSFFNFSLNQRQPDMYLPLKCTRFKNGGSYFMCCAFVFSIDGGDLDRRGDRCTSI